jgi:hypothetical protein
MSSFTSDLDVRITQRKRDERVLAELLASFSYDVGAEGSGDTIRVPVGFETDFASIPRLLWIIEPPLGDSGKAAVLHDWLYETGERSREAADAIFREAMGVLGVHPVKVWLMWAAVRLFGSGGYKARRAAAAAPEAAPPGHGS